MERISVYVSLGFCIDRMWNSIFNRTLTKITHKQDFKFYLHFYRMMIKIFVYYFTFFPHFFFLLFSQPSNWKTIKRVRRVKGLILLLSAFLSCWCAVSSFLMCPSGGNLRTVQFRTWSCLCTGFEQRLIWWTLAHIML